MRKYSIMLFLLIVSSSIQATEWICSAQCAFYRTNGEIETMGGPSAPPKFGRADNPATALENLYRKCKEDPNSMARPVVSISVQKQSMTFANINNSCVKIE